MNGSSDTDFDPLLRQALRRALSADSAAPADLRHRVANLMSETPATIAKSWWRRSATRYSAAVAACLLLGLGVAIQTGLFGTKDGAVTSAAIIPTDIQQALLARHDWCDTNLADHHRLDVPRDDMGKIAQAMDSSLHQGVWVADLRTEGWQFRGAKICPVGQGESAKQSAHLLFQKSGDVASVFSLSLRDSGDGAPRGGACGAGKEGDCCFPLNGHVVSGFVDHGRLYCIVVKSPRNTTTLADVRALRDRHRAEIVAMANEAERIMLASAH